MKFEAEQYARDVLSGEQTACRWVRLAAERHVNDLEDAAERGLYFDERSAKVVIAFFSVLSHWKGEWAGMAIRLEPWQQFILWVLFGWKKEDGTRRFKTSYLEVARKNGKTTLAAGVGLFLMVADNEPGAEIYTAATKRDQARIAHKDATEMVKASPQLKQLIKSFKDNLNYPDTASKFEPLGRDADSTDGLNVHGAVIDEVHAWKTRDLWDKLDTATGARRQPLLFAITTAGFDRQSLCFQLHDYTQKVLEGIIKDDSHFGIIYGLDQDDDWQDEANWIKSNPNLGVSKKWNDIRRKAARAKDMPASLNAFLRLELNLWTQSESRWIGPDPWARCGQLPVDPEQLTGARCFGGLDLSSNIDITAFVLVFPPKKDVDPYSVLCRFWIPEENMIERVRRDRVPYDAWVRQGFIRATPGNVIDYAFVLHEIENLMEQYDIGEIAYDRWGATLIFQQLMELGGDEFPVQFGQGFASMSPPMKELEKLILSERLAHGNNPVLNWMADNLVARQDPAGNLKPDKEKSIEKIDGMVALIMALDRAVHNGGRRDSVYLSRGLRVL